MWLQSVTFVNGACLPFAGWHFSLKGVISLLIAGLNAHSTMSTLEIWRKSD